MELMPRSDRAKLMDFVKFKGVVDGSRKSRSIVRRSWVSSNFAMVGSFFRLYEMTLRNIVAIKFYLIEKLFLEVCLHVCARARHEFQSKGTSVKHTNFIEHRDMNMFLPARSSYRCTSSPLFAA